MEPKGEASQRCSWVTAGERTQIRKDRPSWPPQRWGDWGWVDTVTPGGLPTGPLMPQFPHLSREQERVIPQPAAGCASRAARAPVAAADPRGPRSAPVASRAPALPSRPRSAVGRTYTAAPGLGSEH